MAYDDEVECSDSYQYSVNYCKYIVCENKYKDAIKFNQPLKNASIEFLIHAHSNLNNHQNTNGLSNKEQNKPFDIESSLSERKSDDQYQYSYRCLYSWRDFYIQKY